MYPARLRRLASLPLRGSLLARERFQRLRDAERDSRAPFGIGTVALRVETPGLMKREVDEGARREPPANRTGPEAKVEVRGIREILGRKIKGRMDLTRLGEREELRPSGVLLRERRRARLLARERG